MLRPFPLLAAGLLILHLFSLSAVAAAPYPSRAITVICPFGAGSGSDRIFRVALPYLEKALGQKIVMDYKSGGGGVVGSNYFMTTKADGYTLLFYSQPHITMQSTFQKTAYNNDNLVPILGMTWRPDILTVRADGPFRTLNDLVAYARAHPGKLTIGNTGSLSSNHLAFSLFTRAAGMTATRVPFESGGKMNIALVGGQIDACFSNMQWLSVYPGQIRALASAAAERPAADIPTFTELGYPQLEGVASLDVLCVRKGTPDNVITLLREKVVPLLSDEQVRADYLQAGIDYGMFDGPAVEKIVTRFHRQAADMRDVILESMR